MYYKSYISDPIEEVRGERGPERRTQVLGSAVTPGCAQVDW